MWNTVGSGNVRLPPRVMWGTRHKKYTALHLWQEGDVLLSSATVTREKHYEARRTLVRLNKSSAGRGSNFRATFLLPVLLSFCRR